MQNSREKLESYGLNKYYDIEKLIEQNHPLITQNENFLEEFTEQLNKLSKLNNFDHIIYKTQISGDFWSNFWSTVSEIKVICLLLDKADDFLIIKPNKSSPDFKIKKCNVDITIEVKMIQDKFSNRKLMKNETLIKRKYLFSWDGIPGTDDGKLIEFIEQRHNIDWLKTAKIEKIDNDRSIKISNEINFLLLRLNDKKTKADLIIDDVRTDEEFITKTEKGKLNIYLGDKVYKIDDISTILTAITASKGQYYKKTPHIIIIDCVSGGIQEDEFEEILYFQKDKPLQGNDPGYDLYYYDGIFFKKNKTEEFEYHMVSGVAAIFGKRVTFFENPNTSEKIPSNIIKLLGFRIYKPYVLEEVKKEKSV